MSAVADPLAASRALGATGLLQAFNEAGLLSAADVHVAARLAELGGDLHMAFVHTDPLVSPEAISQLWDDLTEIMRTEARKSAQI